MKMVTPERTVIEFVLGAHREMENSDDDAVKQAGEQSIAKARQRYVEGLLKEFREELDRNDRRPTRSRKRIPDIVLALDAKWKLLVSAAPTEIQSHFVADHFKQVCKQRLPGSYYDMAFDS